MLQLVKTTVAFTMMLSVLATPADDMENLMSACENTAVIIEASLGDAAALNTSSLIQTIVWQLGASLANISTQNSTTTTSSSSTNSTASLDGPYFDYIDSLINLSSSLLRRGQAPHNEANAPVFSTIQSLASAVQTYGFQLGGQISRSATIRTLTAGDSLVDAEAVWAGAGSSSG